MSAIIVSSLTAEFPATFFKFHVLHGAAKLFPNILRELLIHNINRTADGRF